MRLATSPEIREVLANNPRLPELLRYLDALKGREREEELYEILGVSVQDSNQRGGSSQSRSKPNIDEDDTRVLRQLAALIEQAVRGREQTLGLDWEP